MKVLCIGSAVMDIAATPIENSVNWKEKQRISDIRILPGGEAVNQSIHLADFRVDTALCACTGDDSTGQMLRAALQERNVDVSFVRSKEGIRTGTAMVLINPEGERHIFSVQGAHSTLCAEDLPKVLPEDCRAISLASLFSMPELEWNGLLPYLQTAHHQNIRVFADLAADKQGLGLAGIEPFLPEIDYFLPSLYDVLNMTGTETAEEAARVFRNLGTDHVIIKCGSEGCYCSDKHFSGWIPAIPVRPVDTTGAGDCMSAAFIYRILEGDSMEDACRYACAAGSYSTLFVGASEAKLTDGRVREFMKTNGDTVLS